MFNYITIITWEISHIFAYFDVCCVLRISIIHSELVGYQIVVVTSLWWVPSYPHFSPSILNIWVFQGYSLTPMKNIEFRGLCD